MSQMEVLLAEVSRRLGGVASSMETLQEDQRHLSRELQEIRERLKALETASILEGKYGTKEHEDILRRLRDGDSQFSQFETRMKDAVRLAEAAAKTAESAKHRLNELKDAAELQERERNSNWKRLLEVMKLTAPYLFAILSAIFGWLAQHATTAQAIADHMKKASGGH